MCARDTELGDSQNIEVPKEGRSVVGEEEHGSGCGRGSPRPCREVVQHWPGETMGLEADRWLWSQPATPDINLPGSPVFISKMKLLTT